MIGCGDDDTTDPLPDAGDGGQDVTEIGPDAAPDGVGEDADASGQPDGVADADVVQLPSINVLFSPSDDGFYDFPWPSDLRLNDDGTLNIEDFPSPDAPMVGLYVEVAQTIVGYSTNPVIYFGFEELPTEASLPEVAETLTATGDIQLFDVSTDGCGQRFPVEASLIEDEDQFVDELLLAVAPVPGFVLAPSTQYATVILQSFGAADDVQTAVPDSFQEVLDGTSGHLDLVELYAPLADCMETAGLQADQIAVATVFTTQDPIGELVDMRTVALQADEQAPALTSWEADGSWPADELVTFSATYETPIFQSGNSPYITRGGLVFDGAGMPVIQRWEEVPLYISIPNTAVEPIPVMIWEDGTGAVAANHATDDWVEVMLDAGFAVVAFDPQFHGQRRAPDINPVLYTFNYMNPEAGRTVFRQQVTDTAYLIRMLREGMGTATGLPQLNTDVFYYSGQSQGAHVGSIAAAVETEIVAYSLNGVGGYFSTTIVERKDPVDINALIQAALQLEEPLDRFHPVTALAQLSGDASDPINFSNRWRGWEGAEAGANVFLINGINDHAVPTGTVNALTISGDVPPIVGYGWDVDPLGLWDMDELDLPIASNTTALDGSDLTIATFLDAEGDHYTVYNNADAQFLAVDFLVEATTGAASLELD